MLSSTSVVTSTVLAHFLTTGCALMLIRRGPNRRLRLLTGTVGLMSLSQTIVLLQSGGLWMLSGAEMAGIHQILIGALSLLAIHLLAREIYDRNHTDKRLRLIEHETMAVQLAPAAQPAASEIKRPTEAMATDDLLRLFWAVEAASAKLGKQLARTA